jgi:hypothetical protein
MTEFVQLGVGQADIERLSAQAAALEGIDHPGVVELLRFSAQDGVAELVTVEVDGPTLAARPDLPLGELAAVVASVATTLADLHDLGVVHGNVVPHHVLLSADGPVLCGFCPGRTPSDDVHDLGVLIADRVEHGALAELADAACHPDPVLRPTARALAAAIHAKVDRQTSAPAEPAPTLRALLAAHPAGRARRRRFRPAIGAGIAVVVATVAFIAMHPTARPTVAVAPVRSATTTTVAVDTSLPTQVWPAPVATGPAPTIEIDGHKYVVGSAGDIAAVSASSCGATPTVAVLRPSTGAVYTFDALATRGHDTTAAPMESVAGASSLTFEDGDGDGCPDLVVTRTQGEPVVLPVGDGR